MKTDSRVTLGTLPRSARHTCRAFSLIELLIVIAIIAVLAGLLVPAVRKMMIESTRAKATTQAVTVANAIKAYRSTYSKWPGQTASSPVDGTIKADKILDALTNNNRRINFIDVKVGQTLNGYLKDPWDRYYCIAMDENDDGSINGASFKPEGLAGPQGSPMVTNVPRQTVIVMSWGHDLDQPDKRVMSWNR